MTPLKDCGLCQNTRHVLGPNGWVPCECLRRSRIMSARLAAGLAGILGRESWQTFTATQAIEPARTLADVVSASRRGEPRDVLLHGDYRGVEIGFALVLGEAINRGLRVRVTDARALVDQAFERDSEGPDVTREPVLGLRLGSEPSHSWTPGVVERVLRGRAAQGLPTVVAASREPETLLGLYGRAPGIADTLGSFPRVRIERKVGTADE